MKSYNITDGTVTISIDEYADLATDTALYYALMASCSDDVRKHIDQVRSDYYRGIIAPSFAELNAYALRLLQDTHADDHALAIAFNWLQHQVQFTNTTHIAEWVALSKEYERELRHLYELELRDNNEK